jgi:hypothetical protein
MRHLRPFAALFAVAAIAVACSGPPGSSSGGAGQGGGASQPAASTGGGGGGAGGGSNGEFGGITYEITGDVTKSGELNFAFINGGISQFIEGGWVAYFYSEDQNTVIQINSNPATNIVNFGDGETLVVGTSETGCTFDYSKNDASGLKGTIDCTNVIAANAAGTQINVDLHAEVDAHT